MQTRAVINTKEEQLVKTIGSERTGWSKIRGDAFFVPSGKRNGNRPSHTVRSGWPTDVIAVKRNHSRHMVNTFGLAVRESGQIVREMWAPKPSKITQHNVRYVEFRIFGPSTGFFWVPGSSTARLSVCL